MSNYLAVATVTATMRQVIQKAVAAKPRLEDAEVTTLRPEQLVRDRRAKGVNIFLYSISPNAALRNLNEPFRDREGNFIQKPQVALDLYYLFSFYGDEVFLEAQQLLGVTVTTLHAWADLSKEEIAKAIGAGPAQFLAGSDLAMQSEAVRFTPHALSTRELHELWSIFSPAPYFLSAVYKASVILMDAEVSRRQALPVAQSELAVTTPAVPATQPVIEQVLTPVVTASTLASTEPSPRSVSIIASDFTSVDLRQFPAGAAVETGDTFGLIGPNRIPATTTVPNTVSFPLPVDVPAGPLVVRLGRGTAEAVVSSSPFSIIVQPILQETKFAWRRPQPQTETIPIVLVSPQPVYPTLIGAEIALNLELSPGLAHPADFSSVALLRFNVDARFFGELKLGVISSKLRDEFRNNGHRIADDATVQNVNDDEIRIVQAMGLEVYSARRDPSVTAVYYGLQKDDSPGMLPFQMSGVPPGRYLTRLMVAGLESALTKSESGSFDGPVVQVTERPTT